MASRSTCTTSSSPRRPARRPKTPGACAACPDVGLHHFAAFAAADDSCRKDKFEPNEDAATASVLTPETDGVSALATHWEMYGLQICEGDVDSYAIELEANKGVLVLAQFGTEGGQLSLRALGPDGTEVVQGQSILPGENSALVAAATTGTYTIEVSGAPNDYKLFWYFRDNVDPFCVDEFLEPNENPSLTIFLNEGFTEGLQMCPSDKDWFAIDVPDGKQLIIDLLFDAADGDLDLHLLHEGTLVDQSVSATSDESITYTNETGAQQRYDGRSSTGHRGVATSRTRCSS